MKTILVPTDFSLPADNAVRYAMKLAKLFNASILLYHAYIPFQSGFYPLAQRIKENKDTENTLIARLTKMKDQLLKSNKNSQISINVDRGPESTRLVEYCRKNKIDLIVMGTKGASGLKEVLIGSFTADTMIKASCPVLAIPEKYKFRMPKKITYTSGYHNKENKAIKFLVDLNKSFKAKLRILHIAERENWGAPEEKLFLKFKQKIEKECAATFISFQQVTANDISKAILTITLQDKTDILAMSPIKINGFWYRLFHKSLTKTTANHIHIPMLSIPIK
jgi:nucleotide-binding universal stress UspA family protein